jgi:Protein of unknown function (DUF2878)
MSKTQVILNFILSQLGWFIGVLGAAYHWPWLALLMILVIVGSQLWFATALMPAVTLILLTTAAGAVLDQVMLNHHLLQYQSHGWSTSVVPVWILALWMLFATTLNVSLRWLRNRPVITALFGAIGGPMAYLAASKLGAVFIVQTPLSYIVLSVAWACMMLFLINLSKRYDGYVNV